MCDISSMETISTHNKDKLNPDDVSKWIVDMLLCDNMYFQSVTIDAKQLNYKTKQ